MAHEQKKKQRMEINLTNFIPGLCYLFSTKNTLLYINNLLLYLWNWQIMEFVMLIKYENKK